MKNVPCPSFRVMINSIGSAPPTAAFAVAKGLGVSANQLIATVYRAPAVLVDGLEKNIAKTMVDLLESIGFKAHVQSHDEALPEQIDLYDVSIYLTDESKYSHVVKRISEFTALSEEDAASCLLTPPGQILGKVSYASVEALTSYVGDGVSILTSIPQNATYALFLNDSSEVQSRSLLEDLRQANVELINNDGLIAIGLNYQTVSSIWARHGNRDLIKLVNEEFLRYDLVLCGDISILSAEQKDILVKQINIPSDLVESVVASAPVTLIESATLNELTPIMGEFQDVGLQTKADLITFQSLGLVISELAEIEPVVDLLINILPSLDDREMLKHSLALLPYHFPMDLPEIQARVIKQALEGVGAVVMFRESHGCE